jgi:hypothetical protein
VCHACPVQAKLTVNAPGDEYEEEADQVADAVMRMPEPRVQRQIEQEEENEEESIQTKSLAERITPLVQRQIEPEEEETPAEEEEEVQTKQSGGQAPKVGPGLATEIRSLKGRGQPLPQSVRDFFEPRFGCDFGRVRLHTHHHASQIARRLNARAFTIGRDVVLGNGQYAPGSRGGARLLAHELTHVLQQQGGSLHRDMSDRSQVQRLPINSAVTEFKNKINNPKLVKRGQFYWSEELRLAIKSKYQHILNTSWSNPQKAALKAKLDDLLDKCYDPRGKYSAISAKRRQVRRFLASSGNPTASTLKRILGSSRYRARSEGIKVFRMLWREYGRTRTIPNLSRYTKFATLEGLAQFEYIACWSVAERAPGFFVAQGGFSTGSRSPSKAIRGIALCSRVRRDTANLGVGYKRGDVVVYRAGLASAMGKVKAALDDGYVVHARVLSGIYSGAKPRCKEEHSINLIGYTGNKFVFWDPDTTESKEHGGGFGYLYYDSTSKRFTTAQNDSDMRVKSSRSDPHYGDHSGGQHRYQVLRIWTK